MQNTYNEDALLKYPNDSTVKVLGWVGKFISHFVQGARGDQTLIGCEAGRDIVTVTITRGADSHPSVVEPDNNNKFILNKAFEVKRTAYSVKWLPEHFEGDAEVSIGSWTEDDLSLVEPSSNEL